MKKIARLREDGATFKEIGNKYGISSTRVRQILMQYKRITELPEGLEKLPTRTANALKRCGYKSLEQAQQAGRKVLDCKKIGEKSYQKIQSVKEVLEK
jgi:DNA-directed RNA polymerase alpha subunit